MLIPPVEKSPAQVWLQPAPVLAPLADEISVSESAHGPADARRYEYLPTYMIHGLRQLNLEFD